MFTVLIRQKCSLPNNPGESTSHRKETPRLTLSARDYCVTETVPFSQHSLLRAVCAEPSANPCVAVAVQSQSLTELSHNSWSQQPKKGEKRGETGAKSWPALQSLSFFLIQLKMNMERIMTNNYLIFQVSQRLYTHILRNLCCLG